MERTAAVALLDRLHEAQHEAQNQCYGGGGDALLSELLAADVTWTVPGDNRIAGVDREWSTVGLYHVTAQGRIAGCLLLPLDPGEFDMIWSA